jgi:prevent-host-death family protein
VRAYQTAARLADRGAAAPRLAPEDGPVAARLALAVAADREVGALRRRGERVEPAGIRRFISAVNARSKRRHSASVTNAGDGHCRVAYNGAMAENTYCRYNHYMAANAIAAAEANRRFSEVLREVREGATYTVTVHGRPVARIVPVQAGARLTTRARVALLKRLRSARAVDAGRWMRDELYE